MAVIAFGGPSLAAPPVRAPALRLSLSYKIDAVDVARGRGTPGADGLDDLLVNADADLGAGLGWAGASVHVSALMNNGGQPNRRAGTLQGIDNIEVVHARGKIYEAWIDQALPGGVGDLKLGLTDLNSDFDVTDSSSLLLEPTFGISTEIGASGPNGPSIFPSTALAARLNLAPRPDVYLRIGAFNAKAGDPGDPGGVDLRFQQGLLVIGEAAWTGRGKVAAGAWTYTKEQPDIRALLPSGGPAASRSAGAYLNIYQPLWSGADKGPSASAFLRLGVSDGDTTAIRTAGSAGLYATHLLPARPDSAFSVGVSWAELSAKARANAADAGHRLAAAETTLEITYADKVTDHLTLQPDVQFIRRPAADPATPEAVVLAMRATVGF